MSVFAVDGEPSLLRLRIEVAIPGTKEIESGEAILRVPAVAEVKP